MKKLYILLILFLLTIDIYPQLITRGTLPGEIYLSRSWYLNSDNEFVYAVMRSVDNGEHIALQYSSTTMPEQSTRLDIVSDATPGVLYGTNCNKLYISYNYGNTWSFVENTGLDGRYASGCIAGEVYKYNNVDGTKFYRSTEYAINFNLINTQIYGFPEVGVNEGNVYVLSGSTYPFFKLTLHKSSDYGNTFDTLVIDSTIAGYIPTNNFPTITRGYFEGELYLITWHQPCNYYIYYSNDYGQTFELKYQSPECNIYTWGFKFTAGRVPGSFYVMRNTGGEYDYHSHVYIDYSSNYAETFTTYFHSLDSNYVFTEISSIENHKNSISNYPNPFSNTISFDFDKEGILYIYDLYGNIVYSIKVKGNKINLELSFLDSGLYLYNIISENGISETKKLIKY